MKKIIKYLCVLSLVFLLSGCYKINTTMKINKDKSMDFEMIYAIDSNAMDSFSKNFSDLDTTKETIMSDEKKVDNNDNDLTSKEENNDQETISKEDFEKLKEAGFNITEYELNENDHLWKGVKITKHYDNIDDVSKETEKVNAIISGQDTENYTIDDAQFFSKKNGVYKASLVFDFSNEESKDDSIDLSSLQSMFDIKYILILPVKTISNNATNVSEDGQTLTWNLDVTKKNTVNYEFKDWNSNSIEGILSIDNKYLIIGGIILLVIIILIVSKNKKNKDIVPVDNSTVSNNQMMNANITPVSEAKPVVPTEPSEPVVPNDNNLTQ